MKITVVLNGISLKKKSFFRKAVPVLDQFGSTEILETRSRNDAFSLASKAVEKQSDVIIAAGGDGTVHQVVNGILKGRENHKDLPALGIYPIGTGNDFARTFGIEPAPEQLQYLLQTYHSRPLDVGKVTFDAAGEIQARYFVNVADAGMGPDVVKRVLNNGRPFGSAVAYYQAILTTFMTYRPMVVTVKADTWKWTGKLRTIAVANGKYYGHGLGIAPQARTDDGQLDTFLCGDVSVWDFIRYSGTLKKNHRVIHDKVEYNQATVIRMQSESPCGIEADGEWLGQLPATIEMVPVKLKFLRP